MAKPQHTEKDGRKGCGEPQHTVKDGRKGAAAYGEKGREGDFKAGENGIIKILTDILSRSDI